MCDLQQARLMHVSTDTHFQQAMLSPMTAMAKRSTDAANPEASPATRAATHEDSIG